MRVLLSEYRSAVHNSHFSFNGIPHVRCSACGIIVVVGQAFLRVEDDDFKGLKHIDFSKEVVIGRGAFAHRSKARRSRPPSPGDLLKAMQEIPSCCQELARLVHGS